MARLVNSTDRLWGRARSLWGWKAQRIPPLILYFEQLLLGLWPALNAAKFLLDAPLTLPLEL